LKVLFVSSGNIKKFGISPIVINQGKSLEKIGVNVSYYGIKGKGVINYLRNRKILKEKIKKSSFDVIHAHYSFSGILVASTLTKLPIIVSLMGSDTLLKFPYSLIIKIMHKYFWTQTIVKSKSMKKNLRLENSIILPNGVDFSRFYPMSKEKSRKHLGFKNNKKYVIFIGDPNRPEKNFYLAKKSVEIVQKDYSNIELFVVFGKDGVKNEEISYYINAADLLLLTSTREGSPNVIKEAMACNCPIVSTNVGDVKSIIKGISGCFITNFDPKNIAEKIKLAMNYGKTNGRENIYFLNDALIAKKLIHIYKKAKKR